MDITQVLMDLSSEVSTQRELLNQLVKTPPHWSTYLPSLAGLGSVAVALVLGIKSMDASKRQLKLAYEQLKASNQLLEKELRATIVASGRREWIENLRKESSTYIGHVEDFKKLFNKKSYENEEYKDIVSDMTKSQSYINLMLNSEEEETKKINKYMSDITLIMRDGPSENREKHLNQIGKIRENQVAFLNEIRSILKNEWEKVKILA